MGSSDQELVCVVTGASDGIGKAVARDLARLGHHVVMVCRNAAKGQAVLDAICAENTGARIELVVGDLSSIAKTKAAAEAILSRCPRIDVLINNAGVWMNKRALNEDGLEMTFMVNHLAPFILSLSLLPRLRSSAPARIVNVNAGLYVKGEADLDALPTGENFHAFKTYMHTKLLNVLFTVELAKRLAGSGVTVNALHPGVIRTSLGASGGPLGLLIKFVKRFWAAPEDGARPVVYLAVSPDVAAVNGAYYNLEAPMELDAKALDGATAKALWEWSAAKTGVDLPAGA